MIKKVRTKKGLYFDRLKRTVDSLFHQNNERKKANPFLVIKQKVKQKYMRKEQKQIKNNRMNIFEVGSNEQIVVFMKNVKINWFGPLISTYLFFFSSL